MPCDTCCLNATPATIMYTVVAWVSQVSEAKGETSRMRCTLDVSGC